MGEVNFKGENQMIKIAPSIYSADFSNLAQQVKATERGGAKYLHIDVMDGVFVPNITIGPIVIKSIRKESNLVFDVHLMVNKPERYIKDFADAGADIITVHAEATDDIKGCINLIKSYKKKAGVSIKPATDISVISDIIDMVDLVLIMSVEPGFGGQGYLDIADEKIKEAARLAHEGVDISVDGGIKLSNLKRVIRLGANTVVAGSAIFGAEDIEQRTREFVSLSAEAEKCVRL